MAGAGIGPRGRRSLLAGVGLMVSGCLPAFLTASLASRIPEDFAFGDARVGLAIGVFHVVCALSSTPAGRLVDRLGAVPSMRVAAGLTAATCLAVAGLAQSSISLIALLVAGGAANAVAGPAVASLLRSEVAPRRQGLAFGAQQSGASVGALLAGAALPAVAIPFGWRWAFLGVALLALSAAALAPRVDSRPADAPRRAVREGLTSVHALAVAAALASAAGVGLISFVVLYAEHSGMSTSVAGLLLGAVSLGAAVGRVSLGVVADRRGQEPLRPVAMMLAASIAGYLLMMSGEPVVIAVAAVLAGSCGWAWPAGLTLAVVQRSPDAPAWAVGVMATGLFAGATAGPLLLGFLAAQELFAVAWGVCAGCALMAAVTVTATRRLETPSGRLVFGSA